MKIEATALPGVKLLTPRRFEDARGFFSETYNREHLAAAGIAATFVQDNQSLSRRRGTIRGLHYQMAPMAQARLVRVLRGAILDVAVDIRPGSATFGRHVAVELDAERGGQLFVPEGFAHGFCTLADDTEIFYKVSQPYAPDCERGILWSDPALGIAWPVGPEAAVVSDKDRSLPPLARAL
jgi:dTDP-4-dehydrorhamnose 3,5-epimerase